MVDDWKADALADYREASEGGRVITPAIRKMRYCPDPAADDPQWFEADVTLDLVDGAVVFMSNPVPSDPPGSDGQRS